MAQADYIYLNGRPVAVLNGSTLYFLHDDMLGTPQLASDSEQNTQWQASYEPFGTTTSVSGEIVQNLRLPGQYFDVESGWNHNGFRDYVPELGRYLEPDPLGRLGSGNNLYIYVGDNPVNFADPLGLCAAMNHAPNLGSISPLSRWECASMIANDEYSIAAHTSGSLPWNPIVQATLGNSISGLVDLWNSPSIGEGIKNLLIGGVNPGLPGPSYTGGAAGVATDLTLKTIMTNVTSEVGPAATEAAAADIGVLKLLYDVETFGHAYLMDCH